MAENNNGSQEDEDEQKIHTSFEGLYHLFQVTNFSRKIKIITLRKKRSTCFMQFGQSRRSNETEIYLHFLRMIYAPFVSLLGFFLLKMRVQAEQVTYMTMTSLAMQMISFTYNIIALTTFCLFTYFDLNVVGRSGFNGVLLSVACP